MKNSAPHSLQLAQEHKKIQGQAPQTARSQAGGMLALILIAIALFSALAFAITMSGRGNTDISKETMRLDVSEAIMYGTELAQATFRLKSINGCSDTELSFDDHNDTSLYTDGSPYNYANASSPADESCHLFSKAGGNVAPRKIPADIVVTSTPSCAGACLAPDSWLVAPTRVKGVGTDTGGSAATDLVLWLGRVTREACIKINNDLGISNPGGEPPQESFSVGCQGPGFQGTYPNCADPIGDLAQLTGKKAFCFDWSPAAGADNYLYMHVLVAR